MSRKERKIGGRSYREEIFCQCEIRKTILRECHTRNFCPQEESIKHLFFQCRVARSIWSAIQIASNLYPSWPVANVFCNWLHGIDMKNKTIIRVGVLAVIWSL